MPDSGKLLDLSTWPMWRLWLFALFGLVCLLVTARRNTPAISRRRTVLFSAFGLLLFAVWAGMSSQTRGVLWFGGLLGVAWTVPLWWMGPVPPGPPGQGDPAPGKHPAYPAFARRARIASIAVLVIMVVLALLSVIVVGL